MTRTERWLGAITVVAVLTLTAWALAPTPSPSLAPADVSARARVAALDRGTNAHGDNDAADAASAATSGTAVAGVAAAPGAASLTSRALSATDVGVSARSITLGIGLIDLGGLSNAGFGVGLRGDEEEVAKAYVDDLNRRGGIHGRTVTARIYSVDPLDASKARAACLQATEQDRVFAYVDTLSMYSAAQQACIAGEHRTPLVTPTPLAADVAAQMFPNHVSPIQNDNRTFQGAIAIAHEQGMFDTARGFAKLGLLSETCEPSVNSDIRKALSRVGVGADRISEFTLACDGNNAASQTSQAVVQHRRDGVTHVLVATQYVQLQLYATSADTQLFRPRYLVTDYGGLTADISVENMPASQFDNAWGVTSSFSGAAAVGKPLSPLAQDCNRVLREKRLPEMRNVSGADGVAAYLCETLRLFVTLANLAGPQLTRAGLTAALPSVGTFRGAYTDTAVFDRVRKTSGGDTLAVIVWHRDCNCYRQTVAHRPAGV